MIPTPPQFCLSAIEAHKNQVSSLPGTTKMAGAINSSPDISVVVPSYNHSRFVETCLRSIFSQSLKPTELLVIDDGSSDGSLKIIDRVLGECLFKCELISRSNRGLCATLNEGLANTKGKYFAYLGSDDLWLPGFLQARANSLEERGRAVLAYGNSYLIDEENQIIDCTADWADYIDGDAREMLLWRTIAPMSPTVIYRRSALERHGWNQEVRLEDYDLYLRLSVEGEFAFDPETLSAWRLHAHNASRNQTFMLNERLQAQARLATTLGLTPGELAKLEKRTKFQCAEEFLRIGEKKKAMKLMWRNIRGAKSLFSTARMMIRLCVPFSVMIKRRQRLRSEAYDKYGAIHV